MLELASRALVLLWALCIFLNSIPAEQALGEGTQRAPSPARRRQPAGYEWRKVRRFGGRIVALRLQVLVA